MGHAKLNLALVIAGAFTLGAVFGHPDRAEAAIELAPVVIYSGPISACTDFDIVDEEGTALCHDDGKTYDLDHYMVEADTDGEGFYLGVWQ